MTGTTFSEVYDLFMQKVTDYRLIDLYNASKTDFETYLESWLYFSIVDFGICDQSLAYETSTKTFTETLTLKNKVVLVYLMMKHWMQKNVNDITQMNLHVTDRDFKVASEAANLREKVAALGVIREECSQLLNNYDFANVDWDSWNNQEF